MDRDQAKARVRADRWWAHGVFFGHRHEVGPARFHEQLVADFWCEARYFVDLAFRGGGKSTLAEEDICLGVCGGEWRNVLIIGSSETRAAERLAAISYELEQNEGLLALYGEQKGDPWSQTKLVTRGGVCIQAMGRDQDLRGIKHRDARPDFVLADDFEDKDNVQTPTGRARTMRWFLTELLPACAPKRKVRVIATPMDPESVPMRLIGEAGWPHHRFPIVDADGRPTWPEWYSGEWIEEERRTYVALGQGGAWASEYMVEAVSEADRVFRPGDMRVVERLRTWQPVFAMIDPARTKGRESATTGWAVWSWLNNRLIVWDAGARHLMPDEIVDLACQIERRWRPVKLGIEKTGLDEWLMQPLRAAVVKLGLAPVVEGIAAPRGKLSFIRGLQPFFVAGEVEFAGELRELREQLLGFPTGRIDAPNALAYATHEKLRPGLPVYESFGAEHVAADLPAAAAAAVLALNVGHGALAAVLFQMAGGGLRVLADWLLEGEVGPWAEELLGEAAVQLGARPQIICPPLLFEAWERSGLVPALMRMGERPRKGADPRIGREWLRERLERKLGGSPRVRVALQARRVVNGLAGGFARAMEKGRGLSPEPVDNIYRVLIEGLESAVGLAVRSNDDDEDKNWAYDRSGRRYLSAMPGARA